MLKILLCCLLILLKVTIIRSILPLKDPPNEFIQQMERDGISLERFYVDDSNQGNGTHYMYSQLSVNTYIKNMDQIINKVKLLIERKVDKNIVLHQVQKQHWIIIALLQLQEEYSISLKNKNVLIIGSTEPWLESICIVLGASNITTIDYNNLTYHNEKIKTFSKYDFDMFYNNSGPYINSYDFVIGLRSFDHSGLGRYGDIIDYNADIDSINKAKMMLKNNGIFIFTVPIGRDLVIWNLQRRYGSIRLPKLLGNGFHELNRLGWKNELFDANNDYRKTYEPVFIQQKRSLAANDNEL